MQIEVARASACRIETRLDPRVRASRRVSTRQTRVSAPRKPGDKLRNFRRKALRTIPWFELESWISRKLRIRLDIPVEHPCDLACQPQIPVAGQVGVVGVQGQPVALIGRLFAM